MQILRRTGGPGSIGTLVAALAVLSAIIVTGCTDEPSSSPPDEIPPGSTDAAAPVSSPPMTETPTPPDSEGAEAGEPTEKPEGGSVILASVGAGMLHTCRVRTDGSLECWGSNEDFDGNVVGQATPPSGEFASVSAGRVHTCGVRSDGSVECWGADTPGQATTPLEAPAAP